MQGPASSATIDTPELSFQNRSAGKESPLESVQSSAVASPSCSVKPGCRRIRIRMTVGHIVSIKISQGLRKISTSHVFDNSWYRDRSQLCHGTLPQGRRRWWRCRCRWRRNNRSWRSACPWRFITRFFERLFDKIVILDHCDRNAEINHTNKSNNCNKSNNWTNFTIRLAFK